MPCKRCVKFKEKYPLIKGEDGKMQHRLCDGTELEEIRCAFSWDNPFWGMRANNYHCQTMDALRDNLDYEHRNGDSSIGVIAVPLSSGDFFIILTWYKDRGRVSDAYLVADGLDIEPLILGIAEDTLKARGIE